MPQKMSWLQMQSRYPNEWLLITDFKLNQYQELISGTVIRHSHDKDAVCIPLAQDIDLALRYTGQSAFLGFRSHWQQHAHSV